MKKFLSFILFFSCIAAILSGQEIKLSVAPTINNVYHFKMLKGEPNRIAKVGFTASIDYLFPKDKKFSFALGLSYQYAQVKFDPFDPFNNPLPFTESINLLSIGFTSFYSLKRDFYLSVSPTLDLQINHYAIQTIDNQSGIGLSLGFGKNIQLNKSVLLNFEPRLWIHNIVPFNDENIPFKMTIAGLNIGLIFGEKE